MMLLILLIAIPPLICLVAQKRFGQVLAPYSCGLMLLCLPAALPYTASGEMGDYALYAVTWADDVPTLE